jgi:hypothetical protein
VTRTSQERFIRLVKRFSALCARLSSAALAEGQNAEPLAEGAAKLICSVGDSRLEVLCLKSTG